MNTAGKSCVHDMGEWWRNPIDGRGVLKHSMNKDTPICPFCMEAKPKIKTPEEIAKEIWILAYGIVDDDGVADEDGIKMVIDSIADTISAERNANLEKIRELEKRVETNRLYGYRDGKKEMEDVIKKLENELYRIRYVAERLRDSDDENEISIEENIAGKYMIKVLDGENFS